jgi:ABC-type Fe3+ transport system permease subunit
MGIIKINLFLVLFLFILPLSSISVSAQTDVASTIVTARTQLTNAYRAALQAEQAGANITQLADTLNEAGSVLAKAEHAYSVGDFTASQDLALQCQALLDNFGASADALKESALQKVAQDFWVTLIYPIFGALAVVVVGLALWYLLKRKFGISREDTSESPAL